MPDPASRTSGRPPGPVRRFIERYRRALVAIVCALGLAGPAVFAGNALVSRQYNVVVGSRPSAPTPGLPTASNTGVPAGTTLTDLPLTVDNAAYAVTTANTVLDGVHIPGHLLIRADNVTIRNSWIEGSVYNDWQGGYMHYEIYDSTLTHTPGINQFNCNVSPGLMWSNYVARRVNITGHDDGFRFTEGGPVDIQDSYARMCWVDATVSPPDGSHSGGIQAECATPCGQLTLVHNNIDNNQRCPGPSNCGESPPGELLSNSGISVQSFTGNIVNGPVTITDNLISGGGYTMILWSTGANYQVHNNRVSNGDWAFGPADTLSTCEVQTWSGNTIVTLDPNDPTYTITGTVGPLDCVD